MALITRGLVVVLLGATLPLLLLTHEAEASEVGVSYGTVAGDLPDPSKVSKLLKDNGITMVRIYDANSTVLTSLANTGIKLMVMMPNANIHAAATDKSAALRWVQENVKAYYPATLINGVAVGNEVFDSSPELTSDLVPAMTNVHDALVQLGLADAVKVSTPVAFDALKDTFPPSTGRFKDEIAESVMKPMVEFLQRTGSSLTMNIYPFFAYATQTPGTISLDYALGNSNAAGVPDDRTGLVYYSLLDAQRDAAYYAVEALLQSSSAASTMKASGHDVGVSMTYTESGWPNRGTIKHGHGSGRRLLQDTDGAASIANAQAYNNNLINRVLSGNTGTPHRPGASMDAYIFALFNENGKGSSDDVESNFGLFYPSMQKVYEFSFTGPVPAPAPPKVSWCVANAAVGDARLQAALDYACANGADCGAIQPGGSCFDPDTKLAHASYAVNSYYQNKGRAAGACDFNGAASVVFQKPADTCGVKPMTWCVANAAVGDARLQAALDYACANGADCSAIQAGGSCFQPNTKVAHASYAFNSYYQNKGRADGSCDFNGAASVVNQQPADTCGASPPATWCVANSAVGDARLQTALDYACSNGADCSAIQAGGACFQPDTKVAHASYAFNSYYQRKGRAAGTCDFSGAGSIVNQAPRFGNCVLPSNG